PITDTFFTRATIASFQQDGYVTRTFDGKDLGDKDVIATRLAARWLATDNVELNVNFDYSRERENGNPYVLTGVQPINIGILTGGGPSMTLAANTLAAQLATGGPASFVGGDFFDVTDPTGFPFQFLECFTAAQQGNPLCINQFYIDDGSKKENFGTDPSFQKLDVWGASATLDWELNDSLKIKSISAWRNFEGHFEGDQDGSPVRVSYLIDIYQHEQWSQELQLLGNSFDDRLEW
ncbi:MAG: hypothetical protein GTO60_01880, partial [Gammaproteobacteria bacterium]|nr:hypothetical protein [Gammaproteobacteria bacterium]NIO61316.1 hypothetical protein [Gammaproteobacteria bacterium]